MPQKDPEKPNGRIQTNYPLGTSRTVEDNGEISSLGKKVPGMSGIVPVGAVPEWGISSLHADSILILLNTESGCLYRTLNGGQFFYHKKEKARENQDRLRTREEG
jgi:hypothetical protein